MGQDGIQDGILRGGWGCPLGPPLSLYCANRIASYFFPFAASRPAVEGGTIPAVRKYPSTFT